MLNESKTINKYPDRAKFVTNFAAKDWLTKRIEYVKQLGDPDRLKLYDGITADDLLIEEPTVFNKSKGYFYSSIVARKNGLCFPDPNIDILTFPKFLTGIDPNHSFYNKPGVSKSLTFKELMTMVNAAPDEPSATEYTLTKMAGSDKYILVVTSSAMVVDLDAICTLLFADYNFESIEAYAWETEDDAYPKTEQTTIAGYVVGSITMTDRLLAEQTVTIDITNILTIKNVSSETPLPNLYNGKHYYDGKITYRTDP